VSDRIVVRIPTNPGESFLDRMIALVEGAKRQKTPNEIALTILLVGMSLIFLIVVATLPAFASWSGTVVPMVFLIALFVTLIPTTIGGLLSAIGIAGMDRLVKFNVIAKSGRSVEAAGDLDVLLHCAGDVSFDPPIDQAFMTNVVGTKALLTKLREACSDDEGNLVKIPHYLHVSTAYTAGRRRGAIPEAAHIHDIDYEAETRAALAMKEHVEARSRSSEQLTKLREEAEALHRQAGYLTTSEDTERRRQEWVKQELVAAGTEMSR